MLINKKKIQAVLFDFDGTLADTSYDMINCLNKLLKNYNRKNIDINLAKNFISKGAGGLIDYSCPDLSVSDRKMYIDEFLNIYKDNMFINTHLFEGINEIIDIIVKKNYKWGIVTNKPGFLAIPIIRMLNFTHQPNCLITGDTLNVKKPNPEPLLYAANQILCNPAYCIYIGDDVRDIIAAKAAGMISVAASYGFIEKYHLIKEWKSDYIIDTPLDLKKLLN